MGKLKKKFKSTISKKSDVHSDKLLDFALISMLAKFVGCGNCIDYAAVGLTEFLMQNFKGPIEFLELKSTEDKDTHCFLVLNRDPKSDLNKPETWNKETILFDGWNRQLRELSKPLSIVELAADSEVKGNEDSLILERHLCINEPLSELQLERIIDYLKAFRDFVQTEGADISSVLAQILSPKSGTVTAQNPDEILRNFINHIDNEIQQYVKLKNDIQLVKKHTASLPSFEKSVNARDDRSRLFSESAQSKEIELLDLKDISKDSQESKSHRKT